MRVAVDGAGKVCGGHYYTMVDAVTQYVPNAVFLKGVSGVGDRGGRITPEDTVGIANATALSKASDTTIMVIGTDLSTAHEGHDVRPTAVHACTSS